MKKINLIKRIAIAAVSVTVMAGFSGCDSGSASKNGDESVSQSTVGNSSDHDKDSSETPAEYDYPAEINVGEFSTLIHQNLAKLADALGYFDEEFAKEGIKVNLIACDSAAVINEGIAADNIDFAFFGDQPTINGIANNVGITVLGSNMRTEKANALMVLPDSDITSVEDLKGRSIGVSLGTAQHEMLLKMLADHGITEEQVELNNLGAADAVNAVLAGQLDAALVSNQMLVAYEENGTLRVLADATGYPTMNVFVGRTEFIEAYPEITQRYVQVLLRAEAYRNGHPDEAAEIISEICEEDKDTVLKLWPLYEMKLEATDSELEFLDETYAFLKKYGGLASDFDPKDYTDFSYVNNAYKLEGLE